MFSVSGLAEVVVVSLDSGSAGFLCSSWWWWPLMSELGEDELELLEELVEE